ncbi:MAG: S-layer homology domain-containing protein, partial [Bacteroidales bacterium]|nr:S-layer homology domain-containing protein [Bacteroidales bacterium]
MRRLLSITLLFALILGVAAVANPIRATTVEHGTFEDTLDRANALKDLGLFLGTDKGFDLERAPTRVEALALLIRTLGEERASKGTWFDRHPFTDVPSWADNYVTYAYAMGYSNGVSATSFGSSDIATPEQFITFMLRALGYSDARGDFVWSESIQKAEELN